MSAADHGETDRAMSTLQARVSEALAQVARQDAEIVKLKGQVAALSGRVADLETKVARDTLEHGPAQPEALVDPADTLSEVDKVAMRERLRAASLAGIKANKLDRYRAGRTYRRDRKLLTDVE